MEAKTRHSSGSDDRPRARRMTVIRSSDPEHVSKIKDKEKHKSSCIPILKGEKLDGGNNSKIQRKSSSYSRIHRRDPSHQERASNIDEKLKLLEEKERYIADYYVKVQDLIKKYASNEDDEKIVQIESFRNTPSKNCPTEPTVDGGQVNNDFLSDFETYVKQISEIWLATSSDFSSALKNLKSCSSMRPMDLEMENVKVQLAIKQAKSLTLAKTRSVIEEVKKLLQHREIIRSELEKLLSNNDLKFKCGKCGSTKVVPDKGWEEFSERLSKLGTGDSYKTDDLEDQESNSGSSLFEESENKGRNALLSRKSIAPSGKSLYFEEKEKSSGETEGTDSVSEEPTGSAKHPESWAKELAKKNETITNLNSKISKLQKTFNEQSLKYDELQVKLSECHEKIQWNEALWKHIGKLKDQIKGLQQSNKQLEMQKKKLEAKLARLDQEIDRLIKMNELLNKKKFLLSTQENWYKSDEESGRISQERKPPDDKAVAEKQNAITQLKSILNIMTDQKNLAQQQISLYQSKIEELEKMLKRNNGL